MEEIDALIILIQNRNDYENELYDYLLDPGIFNVIDDSFWDPVHISYTQVHHLKDIIGEDTCSICTDNHLNFKKNHCCNQKMCNGCSYRWFESSVKCPFCYQDIREFDLKKM